MTKSLYLNDGRLSNERYDIKAGDIYLAEPDIGKPFLVEASRDNETSSRYHRGKRYIFTPFSEQELKIIICKIKLGKDHQLSFDHPNYDVQPIEIALRFGDYIGAKYEGSGLLWKDIRMYKGADGSFSRDQNATNTRILVWPVELHFQKTN